MGAPKGNQFWKNIDPDSLGRNPKYKTPEELWYAACDYFEDCDKSPLIKKEHTQSDKGSYYKNTEHSIPYTWEGLYVYLGVCNLDHYKTKKVFSGIITHIGNVIYNQKFSGAAAGIFNSNIIARDLGLKDQSDVTSKGQSINSQVDLSKLSDEELRILTQLQSKSRTSEETSD